MLRDKKEEIWLSPHGEPKKRSDKNKAPLKYSITLRLRIDLGRLVWETGMVKTVNGIPTTALTLNTM